VGDGEELITCAVGGRGDPCTRWPERKDVKCRGGISRTFHWSEIWEIFGSFNFAKKILASILCRG
jgi:hypothetical protein